MILLACALVGGLLGFARYKMSKPYYASDMIAQINATNAAEMMDHINDLHNLCREGNYNILSEYLGLDKEISRQIKNINAFWIVDQNKDGVGDYIDYENDFNLTDTTRNRIMDRFDLQVGVFDNSGFSSVKEGLYNYVNSNPYLTGLNENRKKRIKELITTTNEEIIKLDSLQKFEYFKTEPAPGETQGQMMIWNEKELTLLHPELIRLIRQKQNYEKELEIFPDVITVIKDFTPLAQVENPRSQYIIPWAVFTLLLGFFFKLFLEQRKNIIRFINKETN